MEKRGQKNKRRKRKDIKRLEEKLLFQVKNHEQEVQELKDLLETQKNSHLALEASQISNDSLLKQLAKSQQDQDLLSKSLSSLTKKLEIEMKAKIIVDQQLKSLTNNLKSEQKKTQDLSNQIQSLQKSIEEATDPSPHMQKIEELTRELEEKSKKLSEAQTSNSKLRSENLSINKNMNNLQINHKNDKKIQENLIQDKEKKIAQLNCRVQTLNEELADKRREVEGKNKEILEKNVEMVKLQKELEDALKADDKAGRQRLEEVMKVNQDLEYQVKVLNESLERIRKENKEIVAQKFETRDKVEEIKDDGNNSEVHNKVLRRTLTQMKINKDREKQENLKVINNLEQKNKLISDQIQVLKLEVSELKARLSEKEKLVNRLKNLNIDTDDGYLKIKQILSLA